MKAKLALQPKGYFSDIQLLPLIFLILLTAGSMVPAVFWVIDNGPAYLSKVSVLSSAGYSLGFGNTPLKRVTSFYEKHEPAKVNEVDTIMKKYYGDYGKLTKRLERKYHDYGYFLHWEEDDKPMAFVKDKVEEFRVNANEAYDDKAPPVVKQAVMNMKHNIGGLYKKGRKTWKLRIWPILRPYLGTATEAEKKKQKLADKKKYGRKVKGQKGSKKFRDEEDEESEYAETNDEDRL